MGYIEIKTIEDLNDLRFLKPEEGKIVVLGRNLDFKDGRSYRNRENKKDLINFKPIDIFDNKLIFIGDNYKIKNLKMNYKDEYNIGLFNTYGNSTVVVKKLRFEYANIKGKENVGIVGGLFNGSLNDITVHNSKIEAEKTYGVLVGNSLREINIDHAKIYDTYLEAYNLDDYLVGKYNIIQNYKPYTPDKKRTLSR